MLLLSLPALVRALVPLVPLLLLLADVVVVAVAAAVILMVRCLTLCVSAA